MRLGVDPKIDYPFRKVFGSDLNAALLIHLLHAVLEPTPPITAVEIALPQSDKGTALDKQVVADIRARDQGTRHFHVEMQWQAPWHFPKRALFYWATFHSQQLLKGEKYQTLGPTISICFTNQNVFPEVDDHHLAFTLRENKRDLLFCADLEIHLIQLPKFVKTAEELSSDLDRWCYFFRHGEDLDLDNLPASLDVPAIRRAMEVLTVFNHDDHERAIYEARLKAQRDQSSLLEEAREEGMEKGLKKGLTSQVRLCQELLKHPLTPEAELMGMSLDELNALLGRLRKQVLPNGG
jgi:predicted transposase/invertase (TIGR01784 family)